MSDLDNNSNVGISANELSQRRRDLIKGSAVAIPAILTLRSGSALADTSASCLVGPGQVTPPGVVDTIANGDDWLRQSTMCRQISYTPPSAPNPLTSSTSTGKKKKSSSIPTTASDPITKHVFQDPGNTVNWYEYDPSTGTGNNSNPANKWTTVSGGTDASGTMQYQNTGDLYSYTGTTTCFVLIQLNADGTKSGVVGSPTQSAYLATDSCYDSLF